MAIRWWNSTTPAAKVTTIGAVILILLLPLSQLRSLVAERAQMREAAYAKVAQGWGGSLAIGGPILVIPIERTITEGQVLKTIRSERYVLPDTLNFDVTVTKEGDPRRVGIYEVPVYLAAVHASGDFGEIEQRVRPATGETFLWSEARVRLPISAVRSLRELTRAKFADERLQFTPTISALYQAIDAPIRVDRSPGAVHGFDLQFTVAGSREISLLPLAGKTEAHLKANWPDPSFQGAFLPVNRSIDVHGFDARWQVLELNRDFSSTWEGADVSQDRLLQSAFGVGLFQSVDVYQRGERAVKYALVFIGLTFLSFFAWEQVGRFQLHAMQYLLVGLALSVFYLLLIALSEHIAFFWAYWSAAFALVVLLGVYVGSIARHFARGLTTATLMAMVYGVLYALVLSEDYALLVGAIVVFVALAAVMLLTRHVDWQRRGSTVVQEH